MVNRKYKNITNHFTHRSQRNATSFVVPYLLTTARLPQLYYGIFTLVVLIFHYFKITQKLRNKLDYELHLQKHQFKNFSQKILHRNYFYKTY